MTKTMATNELCIDATQTQLPIAGGQTSRHETTIRRIASAVKSYLTGVVARRALRRLECDLERIDDRMLKDIGLDRSEICRVVRHGREY